MPLSATEPLERALQRTRQILFQPFDAAKWLALGFCAFLAQLGQNGSAGLRMDLGHWPERLGPERFAEVAGWVHEHLALVIVAGAALLTLAVALAVAVLWLQARGRFMFLDGVVRDRGAVVEPWKAYAREAGSAFRFKLCLVALPALAAVLLGGSGTALVWTGARLEGLGVLPWAVLVLGICLLVVCLLALALVDLLLNDLVVPAMYARRIDVLAAWRVVRSELLAPHAGAVALYVVVRIAIVMAGGVLVFAAVCLTLCLAGCLLAIPYVGTVVLLPLHVLNRSYSLCFLEQLGGEWVLIEPVTAPPAPAPDEGEPPHARG